MTATTVKMYTAIDSLRILNNLLDKKEKSIYLETAVVVKFILAVLSIFDLYAKMRRGTILLKPNILIRYVATFTIKSLFVIDCFYLFELIALDRCLLGLSINANTRPYLAFKIKNLSRTGIIKYI